MITIYTAKVKVKSFEDARDLFNAMDKLISPIDAMVGNQCSDAKSMLGFINLCYRCEPMTLRIGEMCPSELKSFKEIVRRFEVA